MNPTLFKEGDSMKKLMIVSIALLAAVALAVPAFADNTGGWVANDPNSNVVSLGNGLSNNRPWNTYGLSNNVFLNYSTDATNMNYVIGALHRAGNRGYGAASSNTLMYYCSKNTGVTAMSSPALPTPGTAVTFPSGAGNWTAGP
jgi:hypothetical protein